MTSKKTTAILNANEGLHSARALKKAEDILLYHSYENPYLFSCVMTGSQSIAVYKSAVKEIVRRLRAHGCPTEYFGALEFAEDKGGLHCHVYFLCEAKDKYPGTILKIGDDSKLQKMMKKKGLNPLHISKPENAVHHGRLGSRPFYARPVLQGGRLADCLQWISYLYKNRSKDGVDAREKYFYSEFKANSMKRATSVPGPVADTTNQTNNEGSTNETKPTSQAESSPEASSQGIAPTSSPAARCQAGDSTGAPEARSSEHSAAESSVHVAQARPSSSAGRAGEDYHAIAMQPAYIPGCNSGMTPSPVVALIGQQDTNTDLKRRL